MMDTTEHMGREAVVAHLLADHEENLTSVAEELSAAILRGWHGSDHQAAGEPVHAIPGDIWEDE